MNKKHLKSIPEERTGSTIETFPYLLHLYFVFFQIWLIRSAGILRCATAISASLAAKTKASTIKPSVRVRCSAATCPECPRFPTSRNPRNRVESPKSPFNECVFWLLRARYGVKGGVARRLC